LEKVRSMKVRYRRRAQLDIENIYEYIKDRNPRAATEVAARIRRAADRLGFLPRIGHAGRSQGTYEWVVVGLPYIIVYRLTKQPRRLQFLLYFMAPNVAQTGGAKVHRGLDESITEPEDCWDCRPVSVRPRHAEYVLGDVGKHEISRDRRDLKQARLPPFALDVVFARETEPAVALHGGLAGVPGCL
jgi:toxin ParE1/3/4